MACFSSIAPLSYIDANLLNANISILSFKNVTAKTLAENILLKLIKIIYELLKNLLTLFN